MTDPVSLQAVKAQPVPELVEAIEELLEKAKSGELRNLIACGQTLEGGIVRARSTSEGNTFHLLGAWDVTRDMIVKWINRDEP